MKKLIVIFAIIVGLSGCVATTHYAWTEKSTKFNPDAQKRVAIFPLAGDYTGAVQDALATELMAMGYEVVERSSVSSILREMKYSFSGILNAAQTKEVARASSADSIIFGSVRTTTRGDIHSLDLRFVDIATGDVLWSSSYANPAFVEPSISIREVSASIQETLNKLVDLNQSNNYGSARLYISQNPAVPGKRYKKVALLPFVSPNRYGEDDALYGALLTSLIGNGVELVERKDLDNILNEQVREAAGLYSNVSQAQTSNTGMTEAALSVSTRATREFALTPKDLAGLGQITGADALLVGSFQLQNYSAFDFGIVNLRLIDLSSGKVAWSATYYNGRNMPENYVVTADWFAIAYSPLLTADSRQAYATRLDAALENRKSMGPSIIVRLTPLK